MKKLYSIFIVLALCINGITCVMAEDEIVRIYVSVNGNDANAGTESAPLKTLDGARKKVREVKGDKPVEVIFREGEYRFDKGVYFTEEDSGSETAPVTYKAAQGEKVEFKGSFEFSADSYSTVTNGDVLALMDENAKGRIVQYDLKNLGFNYTLPDTTKVQQFLFLTYPKEEEYVEVYLDEKEQMLSQWPNGDDEYTVWTEAIDKGDSMYGTKGATIKYDTERAKRWKNYKYSWIGGYPSYNYRYERNSVQSVDAENKTLTLSTPSCFGFISKESKTWKIFNLLEEIDLPGEWYIDKDKMILYFYPPEDMAGKKLEISFLSEAFFDMKNVSYVNIEDIEFSEHRATAVMLTSCEYVNIDGCSFRNIGARGVMTTGTERTYYNYSRWKDAGYEIHVKNCVFDNIGGSAVWLEGGNIDTLERGNCSFENNLVMRVSSKAKNVEAINLWGVGNTVKNNNLSSGSFHAITYGGSYHTISNNEFYDVNKCTDDVGVIYSGRDYVARGTEVSYNYIHDNEPHVNISRGYMIGIYLDDSQPGQNVHHNILVNNPVAYFGSGHSNNFKYNTIVNSEKQSMMFYYRDGWSMGNSHTELLEDKEIYFKAFPEMETTLASKYEGKLAYCNITDNLSVNSAGSTIEDLYTGLFGFGTGVSQAKNNVEKSECNDFVNPDKQDYRLKSGSATAKSMPNVLNESYDIEEIGIKNIDYVFDEETAPFSKLYPENGRHAVNNEEVEFVWERVFGANNYRLVIAKDEEMTDIVYDEVVPYNIQKVEGLENYTKYYWQVWANNTSREFNSTWVSDSEPNSFCTIGSEWVTDFQTGNLIKNGGFENGFEGWTVENPYNYMSVVESFVDDAGATKTAVNGTKTFYVSTPASPDNVNDSIGYVYQEIDGTANTDYVLNLSWYDAYSTYGSIKVYGDTTDAENCLATVGNLFSGNGWYSSTAAFNSGEHEKLIVKMEFVLRAGATKYAIDNITLKAAGNTQTIDFELGYPEDFNIRSNAFEVTTEKAYTGTHSIKLTSGNGYPIANATFALDNNQYEILFDYYIESGSLGYRIKYGHGNGWGEYGTNYLKGDTLRTTGSWQTFRSGIQVAGTNKFVELAFQNMATNTVVYIDNIRLVSANQAVDSITITGENRVGGGLHADTENYNYYYKFEDPVSYQWQISSDKKTWSNISGATGMDYDVKNTDASKFIRVKVETSNRYSSLKNNYYSKAIKIADIGELIYKDIVITDSNGNVINSLAESVDKKINVSLSFAGNEERDGSVYFAVFNGDVMCDVKKADHIFNAEQINSVQSSLDLSHIEGDLTGYSLKIFIWDDEMKPIDKENFEM